jgi:uncharacterized RDD family membrane protein YckC
MEITSYQQNYASFSRRLLASFLDFILLIIPVMIAASILPVVGGVLVWLAYAPVLESSVIRATLGKKWMGIQVCSESGERLPFRMALLRALLKLLSSFFLFLPHLLALFTSRKQSAHDLLAETLVVYGRVEVPTADAWAESFRSLFASVSSLRAKGSSAGSSEESDKLAKLERLQSLYERGALTKEEFEGEKKKILN